VHSGNPPQFAGGWQDLDLSGAVGEQRVLVWLGIQSLSGGYFQAISTRMKGDPYEYHRIQWSPQFGTTFRYWGYQGPRQTLAMWGLTDESGVIQWKAAQNDASCTVKVYGYLTLNYEDVEVDTVEALNTWQTVDLSPVIGAQRAFVVLRVRGDDVHSYEGYKMIRSTGRDMGYLTRGSALCRIKSNVTPSLREAEIVSLVTNTSGQVEVKDYTNRPGFYADYDVVFWAPFQATGSAVLLYDGAPSTTPRTLDLSPYVGARSALVNLLVYSQNINATSSIFWPTGDSELWATDEPDIGSLNNAVAGNYTGNQVQVVTNSEGKIDWVNNNTWYNVAVYLFGYASPPPIIAHWPIDNVKAKESTVVRDIVEGGSGNHDGAITTWGYSSFNPGGVNGRNLGYINQYGGWVQNIGNPDDFRVNGELSVMGWACPDQYTGWNQTNLLASCDGTKTGDTTQNSPWCFDVSGRKLRLYWYTSGAWVVVSTTNVVTSRQGFQHFAAVRYEITPGSPSTYGIRFYVDGQLVEDVDNGGAGFSGPVGGESSVPYLGRRQDLVTTYQSDTWIDSFRFYNGALGDSDILAVFQEEFPQVRPQTLEIGSVNAEDTEDGSIYDEVSIDGDSHNTEAGVGGDEYEIVESGDNAERTDCKGAARVIPVH